MNSNRRLTLARLSLKPVQRPPALVQRQQLTTVSPTPAPAKFHLFPLLPTELRLQIWTTFLLTPCTITIIQSQNPHNRFLPRFSNSSGPPALLSINHEARSAALSLQLQGKLECVFTSENTKLYFNPAIDILYFNAEVSPYHFINDVSLSDVLRIKRLAVRDSRLQELKYYFRSSAVFKSLLLEELVIVFDGDVYSGKVHCEKCKVARREAGFGEGKVGWRVPTWNQYVRMGKGDEEARQGRERAYREILGAWVKGGSLWEWVWEVVHEGS
jgi:hypothetical protein